jgi:hypothetical protein
LNIQKAVPCSKYASWKRRIMSCGISDHVVWYRFCHCTWHHIPGFTDTSSLASLDCTHSIPFPYLQKVPEVKSAFFFSMTQNILPLVNTRIQSNYILNCPSKCTCIIEYLCYLLNICYMLRHLLCHPQGELLSLLKTICLS